ncbi:MAG: hypothetical protein LBK95_14365 [Bifidobacteriaceae bacterium]|jgi:hypothetical protein|nr:hypothetical protein [Bifidobacteriaceae bacterium]
MIGLRVPANALWLAGLAALAALSLVACGGPGAESDAAGRADGGKIDAADVAEAAIEEAAAANAFSEAAAAQAIKKLGGLDEAAVAPDWEFRIDEDSMRNYGDDSDYGHGSLTFVKAEGDLTDDDYLAWAGKVFEATAAVSDYGHNVYGYNTGDGTDPDAEIAFEEALGIGSDAWIVMQNWCYRYQGRYIWVNVEKVENPDKESETITDEDGQFNLVSYYNGAAVDVSVGLQEGFDDTMGDLEDALEEHGDEIGDILRD